MKQNLEGSSWEKKYVQKIFDIIKTFDAEVGALQEIEKAKKDK